MIWWIDKILGISLIVTVFIILPIWFVNYREVLRVTIIGDEKEVVRRYWFSYAEIATYKKVKMLCFSRWKFVSGRGVIIQKT